MNIDHNSGSFKNPQVGKIESTSKKYQSMKELRIRAREEEEEERIKRERAETRNRRIAIGGVVLFVTGIIAYNVLKDPSVQVTQPAAETTAKESTDRTLTLQSNPKDQEYIYNYLEKLPKEISGDTRPNLIPTLDVLMRDSQDSQRKRTALLDALDKNNPEEFLLIQNPYMAIDYLYGNTASDEWKDDSHHLYRLLMRSTNPDLKPLKAFIIVYPVSKGVRQKQDVENLTLLLDKLNDKPDLVDEVLKYFSTKDDVLLEEAKKEFRAFLENFPFEDTIREIHGNKILPIGNASIILARPTPTIPTQTSSYLESLRKSPINRQNKRDIFKLA